MNQPTTAIESILFVATKPLTVKRLCELTGATSELVEASLHELDQRHQGESGLRLLRHQQTVQFVTNPSASAMVTAYLKEEQAGELTRPALETLTIIAYRGPISKVQLDTIRGVNCALILRNLMIKGLVEAKAAKDRMQTSYQVTTDFLRFLGLTNIDQLPEYAQLHSEETLDLILNPRAETVNETEHTTAT